MSVFFYSELISIIISSWFIPYLYMKYIYETCTLLFKQDGFWNREVLMRKDNATHTILNDLGDVLVYGIIFNFHTVI